MKYIKNIQMQQAGIYCFISTNYDIKFFVKKDELYKNQLNKKNPFEFNAEVAQVFDDMICRSVPYYLELQDLIAKFSAQFHQSNTAVYDLGCSTGETLYRLANSMPANIRLYGIDSSAAMISKAQEKCSKFANIKFKVEDILNLKLEDPSVVIISYVIQFIKREKRLDFIKSVYAQLNPGGILIIAEKVFLENLNEAFVTLHEKFKEDQEYSKLEIKQKREALEEVLVPSTVEENKQMLANAGFEKVETFFQYLNFCGIIAVK
jgi:tRNA (cmo5U34)-methyltransferase